MAAPVRRRDPLRRQVGRDAGEKGRALAAAAAGKEMRAARMPNSVPGWLLDLGSNQGPTDGPRWCRDQSTLLAASGYSLFAQTAKPG